MLTLEDLEDIDVEQETVLDRYYSKKYYVGKYFCDFSIFAIFVESSRLDVLTLNNNMPLYRLSDSYRTISLVNKSVSLSVFA